MSAFQVLGYIPRTTRLVAGTDTLKKRIAETIVETSDNDLRYTLEVIRDTVSEEEFRQLGYLIIERNGSPLHVFRNFTSRSESFQLYECRSKAIDTSLRATARKRALALTGLFLLLAAMGSGT